MKHELHDVIEQIYCAAIEPEKWPDLFYVLTETADTYALSESDLLGDYEVDTFIKNRISEDRRTFDSAEDRSMIVSPLPQIHDLTPPADTAERTLASESASGPDQISRLLSRHFSQALKLTQRFRVMQEQNDSIKSLLDKLSIGIVICDNQRNIVNMNAYARDILRDMPGTAIRNGLLDISDNELRRKIRKLAEKRHREPLSMPVVLNSKPDSNRDIVCILSRLRNPCVDHRGCIAMFMMHRNAHRVSNVDYIREQFSLTQRETSILRHLAQGLTIKEISGFDRVSEHTVRNQVKSILAKTSTRKQTELVRLVFSEPNGFSDMPLQIGFNEENSRMAKPSGFPAIKYFALKDSHIISYRQYGDPNGIAILHSHGVLGSSCEVPMAIDRLCKEHNYRFIVPDRPGYGLTDLPLISHTDEWTVRMEEFLNGLNIDTCILSGYEAGGLFSSAMACQLPNRTRKLVLTGFGVAPKSETDFNQIQPIYGLTQKLANKMPRVHKIFMKSLIKAMHYSESHFLDKLGEGAHAAEKEFIHSDYFRKVFSLSNENRSKLYADAICMEVAMLQRNWELALNSIKTPTIIWHGKQDHYAPLSLAKKLSNLLPDSREYIMNHQGHFVFFTEWKSIFQSLIASD